MLFLSVFALAGSLLAADPAVGTWKLNVARSRVAPSTQAATKEETMVIRDLGDKTENTTTGIRTDGSRLSGKWLAPKQGGMLTDQQPAVPKGDVVVFTVIDDFTAYFTTLQNGKQVAVNHCVISKDGKAMNCTTKGTDAKGKPYEEVVVYDKQ
jgi:hypothetical protein